MKEVRYRALTQFPHVFHLHYRYSRNEGSPQQGIDTRLVFHVNAKYAGRNDSSPIEGIDTCFIDYFDVSIIEIREAR